MKTMKNTRIQLNLSRHDAAMLMIIVQQALDASYADASDGGLLVEPQFSAAQRLSGRLMALLHKHE